MNYPYASGSIKALESKILDRNKLFVLTKYDKNEFVKVLLSMNYGDGVGSSVEELIANEMEKVKKTIDSLTPSKKDTDLFYLVNDAQNIKILYKIKNYHLDKLDLLHDTGSMNSLGLKKAICDDDDSEITSIQKSLITKLNKLLENVESPKQMSFIIDREIYLFALKETNNKIMKAYLLSQIDFTNIISMIRAKNLKWSKEQFFEAYIDSELINKEIFTNIYDNSSESLIKNLQPFYNEKISKILRDIYTNKNYNKLEMSFESLTLEILCEYKNDLFSIGPMLYYYLTKKAEAQNIRTLYSSSNIELKDLID